MKKLLKEDKADLKTEVKKISLTILLLLFFNSAFSQVPINGFCQLNSFPAFPGFNRMTIAAIDIDSFSDVLLYSPNQKSICIISGNEEGNFTDYKIINTPYQFSNIASFYNIDKKSEQFLFSSRKKRIVGLFDFSSSGKFNLITKINFDSFPENICADDIDGDSKPECLVSGSGFSGLSILSYRNNELLESKIEETVSFGESVFADMSNDGYPDIVAFNLLTGSMDIFFNDGTGNFEKIRSIKVKGKINNLQAIDINRDFYADLVYSSENSLDIIFGDFQSAYDNSLRMTTLNNPDMMSISDFNKDRYPDIAYIDTTKGILSIIFGEKGNEFYPEIFYMMDKNICSLHPITDSRTGSLLLLDKNGKINVISKIYDLPNEVVFLPAIKPSAIVTFDFANDGIPDICFIEKFTHTINFFINNSDGIPSYFYSAPVSDEHTEIYPLRVTKLKKDFYCYSPSGKMLEIIEYNFENSSYDSDQLYLPGIARDLLIKQIGESVRIIIAYEKNKNLQVGEYEHRDFRYNFRDYSRIDSNVISPKLAYSDRPQILYWKENSDTIALIKTELGLESVKYDHLGYVIKLQDQLTGDIDQYIYDGAKPVSINLFDSKDKFWTVTAKGNIFNISNFVAKKSNFVVNKENILSFEGQEKRSSYSGILYLAKDHSFNRIEINNEGRELVLSKLFDADDVTDFIIKKLIGDKKYLFYTSQLKGLLTLHRLN